MTSRYDPFVYIFVVCTPLSFEFLGWGELPQKVVKASAWLVLFVALVFFVASRQWKLNKTRNVESYFLLMIFLFSSVFSGVFYGVLGCAVLLVFLLYLDQKSSCVGYSGVLLRTFVIAVFSLVFINFVSSFKDEAYVFSDGYARLAGVVGHPSQASQLAAVCFVFVFYQNWRWIMKVGALLICMYVMSLSGGRTILISLVIAIALGSLLIENSVKRVVRFLIFFGVAFPFITVIGSDAIEEAMDNLFFLSRTGELREMYTLSGRIPLWEELVSFFLNSPFGGVGYGGSKQELPLLYEARWGWSTDSAHNAYLHVLYETGVLGGLGLLLYLYRVIEDLKSSVLISVFLFLSVVSMMSSAYAGPGISCLMLIMLSLRYMDAELSYRGS